METKEILLPNNLANFVLVEMRERLLQGQTVKIAFGGRSMLPLIDGTGDKITLRPLAEGEVCRPGEVYIFVHQGHYVVHRLMRIEGGVHVFRGDNCYYRERVSRDHVLARLVQIERPDGTVTDCESEAWRSKGRRVARRRTVKNLFLHLSRPRMRKVLSVVYFALLALLMWAPVSGLGLRLNNYVFGLRADHFYHASIYLFCAFFLFDWLQKKPWRILLTALLIGIVTESVQYVLPYRGFDVNDLLANFIGATLGWAALFLLYRGMGKKNKGKGR